MGSQCRAPLKMSLVFAQGMLHKYPKHRRRDSLTFLRAWYLDRTSVASWLPLEVWMTSLSRDVETSYTATPVYVKFRSNQKRRGLFSHRVDIGRETRSFGSRNVCVIEIWRNKWKLSRPNENCFIDVVPIVLGSPLENLHRSKCRFYGLLWTRDHRKHQRSFRLLIIYLSIRSWRSFRKRVQFARYVRI